MQVAVWGGSGGKRERDIPIHTAQIWVSSREKAQDANNVNNRGKGEEAVSIKKGCSGQRESR